MPKLLIAGDRPHIGRSKPANNDLYQALYNQYVTGSICRDQAISGLAARRPDPETPRPQGALV